LNCRPAVNERIVNTPDASIRLTDDRNLWVNGNAVVTEELTPYIEGDSAFDAQFVEFATAIHEERLPMSNAYEARTVVAVMQAVHASQASGAPVELAAAVTTTTRN
jgi:predicted dehydrogenase